MVGQDSAPLRPHRPITMRINMGAAEATKLARRRPRLFPLALPLGPARKPQQRWKMASVALESCESSGPACSDEAAGVTVRALEH